MDQVYFVYRKIPGSMAGLSLNNNCRGSRILLASAASLAGNPRPSAPKAGALAVHHYAPILDDAFENNDRLTDENSQILNRICELIKSIDVENLPKLQEIYNNSPQIQITQQFSVQ